MTTEDRRLRPRKQPRQVRAELTRDRILSAAAHVFAEHGYAAGTTNRIAERARVSIGSLYQYFPNKDAVLLELLTRHLDDGLATVAGVLPLDPGEPFERTVRVVVHAVLEAHRDDPALLQVLIERAPHSRDLVERVGEIQATVVVAVRELLERHPEVTVADTDTAARLVISTLELVVHQLVAAPNAVDPGRLEDEIVAMLCRYLTGGRPGTGGTMGPCHD